EQRYCRLHGVPCAVCGAVPTVAGRCEAHPVPDPASRAEAAGPPVRPDAPPPGSPVSRPPSPPSSRWPDVRSTAGLLAAAVIFLTIAAFAVNEFGMNRPPNPPHQEGRPSGKAARARPGEVDLDRYGLHFTVPYGWEVHEQVQKTDHAWCE